MSIIDQHLGGLIAIFCFAFLLQLILIWRTVNNIADPIVYFSIMLSFAVALGFYAVDTLELFARIVLYIATFYLGIYLAKGALRPNRTAVNPTQHIHHFKLTIFLCCVLFFTANIIVWAKSGVILLSDEPSLQKSTAYAGGLGLVRRINWGLGVFTLIGAVYWWLWERSRIALSILVIALIIQISGGSKGAVLPVFFALGLYFINPFHQKSNKYRIPSKHLPLAALAIGLIPVTLVLFTEHGNLKDAANGFLVRLFYSGDVLLYWGQPEIRAHFSYFGFLDYLRDAFGSLLGMLRIVDYTPPIGNRFVQFTLPAGQEFPDSLGPNLPFYVRGELFFGPLLAPLHSLLIGFIFGLTRRAFIRNRSPNLLRYSALAFTTILANTLPIEEGLAIGRAFDTIMTVGPIYLLVSLLISISRRVKQEKPTGSISSS